VFVHAEYVEEGINEQYIKALQLISEKQYNSAIDELKKIIEENPMFHEAYDKIYSTFKSIDKLEEGKRTAELSGGIAGFIQLTG